MKRLLAAGILAAAALGVGAGGAQHASAASYSGNCLGTTASQSNQLATAAGGQHIVWTAIIWAPSLDTNVGQGAASTPSCMP